VLRSPDLWIHVKELAIFVCDALEEFVDEEWAQILHRLGQVLCDIVVVTQCLRHPHPQLVCIICCRGGPFPLSLELVVAKLESLRPRELFHCPVVRSTTWARATLLASEDDLLEDGHPHERIEFRAADLPQKCFAFNFSEEDGAAAFAHNLADRQCVLKITNVEHWQLKLNMPKVPCTFQDL
jgi:hypothetical protein